MRMNLHLFEGGHSVSVYADDGATAVADKTSDVAKDAEVTLTITPGTGKKVDEIEVVTGGVEVDMDDYTFTMGEEDVVLFVKTKSSTVYYKVTEECSAVVNDVKQTFHKNTVLVLTPNGVPYAVSVESGGATVTMNDAVQSLINQGILVKI